MSFIATTIVLVVLATCWSYLYRKQKSRLPDAGWIAFAFIAPGFVFLGIVDDSFGDSVGIEPALYIERMMRCYAVYLLSTILGSFLKPRMVVLFISAVGGSGVSSFSASDKKRIKISLPYVVGSLAVWILLLVIDRSLSLEFIP